MANKNVWSESDAVWNKQFDGNIFCKNKKQVMDSSGGVEQQRDSQLAQRRAECAEQLREVTRKNIFTFWKTFYDIIFKPQNIFSI